MIYSWLNKTNDRHHTPWEEDDFSLLDDVRYPKFHVFLIFLAVVVALCVLPFIKLFDMLTTIREKAKK